MNIKDLFNGYKLKTDTIKAWGHTVHIQALSAEGVHAMGKHQNAPIKAAAISLIHGVTNEDGTMFFRDKDLKNIMKMSMQDIMLVSGAILELTNLGGDEGKS